MPRTRRVVCDDSVYHIINRGHDRRKLFRDTADYRIFKDTILNYKKKVGFYIYHYCFIIPPMSDFLMKR